jgi:hypothetical protein
MGVTQLKRKARKNHVKSSQRTQAIKLLTKKPVLKNVDIEELKKEFDK